MGKELSGIHINFAQNLLKGQFMHKLWHLQSTLLQEKKQKSIERREDATNCALYQLAPLDCHHHHRQQKNKF